MATVNEITQDIIAQARLIDPNISLEPGTPERKIVEAVAESIATATVDIEVLSGQLYLDELAGSRIDTFVSLFGFGRRIGTRATGIVTLSRPNASTYDTTIPKGTQFSTRPNASIPGLIFVATETVRLRADETRVLVRVECTTPGTIGNLPAGVIDGLPNSINIPGITSVTNEVPTSGGADSETDEQLKARFQNTIFRNMAGTNDQFLALALSHPAVSKSNIIGPQSRYVEYIQMPSSPDGSPHPYSSATNVYTTTLSSVPYSKYTYSNNYYVSKGVGKTGKFLKPSKDFIFNNPALLAGGTGSIPSGNVVPNFTLLNDSTVVDGVTIDIPDNIFLFEHTYLSRASRNDWQNGIYNCVDVYINGEQDTLASSEEAYPTSVMAFVNDDTQITHYENFRRIATNDYPLVGSRLQVLYYQPVTDTVEGSITINGEIYYEAKYMHPNGKAFTTYAVYNSGSYYTDNSYSTLATPAHYFIVEDISTYRGTIRARDGIEWLPSSAIFGVKPVPADGSRYNVNYYFNSAVSELQAILERNKQITTDVLVHESDYKYMRLYLTIMYTPGFTESTVNLDIASSVSAFFNAQYYGSAVQMSDILQVVHNTSGVDNVRWTYENGVGGHKIEETTKTGSSFAVPVYYDGDFLLNDNELPALPDIYDGEQIENALVIEIKAQNTWDS